MPVELTTDMPTSSQLAQVSYDYNYPRGLDLKPGSEFHDKLLAKILRRANESATRMRERHSAWRDIERTLTAYIPPKTKREARQKGDKTMPVIIPASYATLETLLTYMVAAFLQDPIFRYYGTGPEDTVGALLLERVVQAQCARMKVGLSLHTQWRDGFAYGLGVTPLEWHTHMGYKRTVTTRSIFGKVISTKRTRKYGVLFEGNKLGNVDPFLYLPDISVAVQDVQDGEFVGWVDRDNKIRLLDEEGQTGSNLFNVRYLKHITGRSSVYPLGERIEEDYAKEYKSGTFSSPVDVIPFY
ncbi:hypothetical protein LCGC14_1907370, partial [marine sediment metagenome]